MRRLMLYNHGGCENRGCEAIVRSSSALFKGYGDVRIELSSLTPGYDRSVGISDIDRIEDAVISPHSLRRLINSIGFRLGMPREEEVARKYGTTVDMGKRSDVCLSVGGDTYCYGRQEHLYVINKQLKKRRKKLVLWGCSIEPSIIEGELLEDLRNYDWIIARESITYGALKEQGLPVRQMCDPAFFLETQMMPLPQEWIEGKTIGINVSPLILGCAKDKQDTVDAFKTLIKHILDTSDAAIALIPHVTWAHDNDLEALKMLKDAFPREKRVFTLPGNLSAAQYKGYVGRLKALITARTHVSIAGYSSAVPTLVIGYSVKARGIAKDLYGQPDGHVLAVQEMSGTRQLIDEYEKLIARADAEHIYLSEKLGEYMNGHEEIVRMIMEM